MSRLDREGRLPDNVHLYDFVSRMDYAYSVADLVISRAGAGSISELCLLQKPVILVPSPNVAEDHQTKNALALVRKDAAVMISDADAPAKLFATALSLVHDDDRLKAMSINIGRLAQRDSAKRIVDEIEKILISRKALGDSVPK
jgi:UDP-N-acetylglucosamine--N-acetylmuramyl-(pentapeptide) pyrophosphoryl-undecaprenol N-acetylglucosamine transferase